MPTTKKWNKPPAWNFINLTDFNGSVRGSGTITSQTRQVADFNSIVVNYPVELTIQMRFLSVNAMNLPSGDHAGSFLYLSRLW